MNKEMKVKNAGNGKMRTTGKRSEEISRPGAAIKVERLRLTKDERESLSVNTRLSDLQVSEVKKAA